MCKEFICVKIVNTLNPCAKGFSINIDEPDGTILIANVSIISNRNRSKVNMIGYVKAKLVTFDFLLTDYVSNRIQFLDSIQIQLKKQGEPLQFKFGDFCQYVCGAEIFIEDFANSKCTEAYPVINSNCSFQRTCKWEIPFKSCTWTIKINKCTWIVKNMNKVNYDGVEYAFSTSPLIAGLINPAFVAELNAIEASAFTVSIVAGMVQVKYVGTASVSFFNSCEEITKTCI